MKRQKNQINKSEGNRCQGDNKNVYLMFGELLEVESKSAMDSRIGKINTENFTDPKRDKPQILKAQQFPEDNFFKFTLKCTMMKYPNSKPKIFPNKSEKKEINFKESTVTLKLT